MFMVYEALRCVCGGGTCRGSWTVGMFETSKILNTHPAILTLNKFLLSPSKWYIFKSIHRKSYGYNKQYGEKSGRAIFIFVDTILFNDAGKIAFIYSFFPKMYYSTSYRITCKVYTVRRRTYGSTRGCLAPSVQTIIIIHVLGELFFVRENTSFFWLVSVVLIKRKSCQNHNALYTRTCWRWVMISKNCLRTWIDRTFIDNMAYKYNKNGRCLIYLMFSSTTQLVTYIK